MTVGTHERIRKADTIALVHATRQVFEVDLVNNADSWWYDFKGIKGLHAPLHKLVTLFIALELQLHVEIK